MFFRESKSKNLQKTLKILSEYHAMPLDSHIFKRQYKHVFALINILKKENK